MSIVLYLGGNIKEYEEKYEEIIKKGISEERFQCELCLRPMGIHSHYTRGIKETGELLSITIVWCSTCRKWHALLPEFLLPHKHYSGNEVESVIIDSATEVVKLIETSASESTVRRWIKQITERITQAVGILKYLFRQSGKAVNEIIINPGVCYSELEQVLEMAPNILKCSGNKLGMANMWLGTTEMPVYI